MPSTGPQTRAAELIIKEARVEHHNAIEQIIDAVLKILNSANRSDDPSALDEADDCNEVDQS